MKTDQMLEQLSRQVVDYGGRVVGVLVLLFAAWLLAGWLARVVARMLGTAPLDQTVTRFLSKLTRWSVLGLAVLASLSIFGVETTSFAAVLGALGVTIGLAFQGTLSNFSAGLMLLIFRPFKVGDVVTAAGQTGKVFEIELFTTAIDTFDNRRFIIPNSAIFGSTIENISYHTQRRIDVSVGVAYSASIDATREVLHQAVSQVEGVLADPPPGISLTNLGASSVDWTLRVWANADAFGSVKEGLIRAVKNSLDNAGIEIPFPQMDVHLSSPEPT